MTSPSPQTKTFHDNLTERFPLNSSVRVTLSNGVKLHGTLFAIYLDHLLMEDKMSASQQLVRFEHIATVGANTTS